MFRLTLANIFVAVAFVASAQAMCLHGTTLMRREEGHVPVATFGYSGVKGPANWASLDPKNSLCNTGSHQAPIVLTSEIPFVQTPPAWNLPSVHNATFENLGSTVEVILEQGEIEFSGKKYTIKQFHAHTPSEHRIDEEYFPFELHFVHQAEDESLLVVAVPFEISEDGQTAEPLTSLADHLADIATPGTETTVGPLNLEAIVQAVTSGQLYEYSGSLTTPPCAEGVKFLVLKSPLSIAPKPYKEFKKVIKFNSRFSQNNGENVLKLAAEQYNVQTGGGSSYNGTTGLPLDANAIIQALLTSGKHLVIESTTTVKLAGPEGDAPVPEPSDVPVETPSGEPTVSTEAPAETESGGIHAPGPATPVRRSNIVRRRY